jgi:hypothetical protein
MTNLSALAGGLGYSETYQPGRIYLGEAVSAGGDSTLTGNFIGFLAFLLRPGQHTVASVAIACSASGNIRAGLYDTGADGYPDTLLYESASTASPGSGTTLCPLTGAAVSGGAQGRLIWIAVLPSSAGIVRTSLIALTYRSVGHVAGIASADGIHAGEFGRIGVAYTLAHTFGALPNPAANPVFSASYPKVGLSFA